MTTTERENRMERMRIVIPEGNTDPLRQVLSEAMNAMVDHQFAETISQTDLYSAIIKKLMRFKTDEEGLFAEKSLCRIMLLTVHEYYMFGIIYDKLRIRNEDLLDVRQRLLAFPKVASEVYFDGFYRPFKLSNMIAGHNEAFKNYVANALREKGMEDNIDIELSTYIVSYSSIMETIVKEYNYLLSLLGYRKSDIEELKDGTKGSK